MFDPRPVGQSLHPEQRPEPAFADRLGTIISSSLDVHFTDSAYSTSTKGEQGPCCRAPQVLSLHSFGAMGGHASPSPDDRHAEGWLGLLLGLCWARERNWHHTGERGKSTHTYFGYILGDTEDFLRDNPKKGQNGNAFIRS